jgi:hypothetical protein
MLKIKDNVDLKELEKYEFEYIEDEEPYYVYDLKDNRTYLVIDAKTKEIGLSTSLYGDIPSRYIDNFDLLYDLIKADLVEKEMMKNEEKSIKEMG